MEKTQMKQFLGLLENFIWDTTADYPVNFYYLSKAQKILDTLYLINNYKEKTKDYQHNNLLEKENKNKIETLNKELKSWTGNSIFER